MPRGGTQVSEMRATKVTVRPATLNRFTTVPIGSKKKRRVAAYARVSTNSEEQATSYEAQVSYYTEHIKSNSEWKFVHVYTEMLTPSLIQTHPTCTQIAP